MKASRLLAGLALVGLLVSVGCFDRDLTDIIPGVTTGVTIRVEQIGVVRVDIVVLVDNSGSMAQEQEALITRFPELINELVDPGDTDGDTRPDHPPVEDLNIAVITPDMGTAGYRVSTCANSDFGDDGCFRSTAIVGGGCSASYPSFLSRNEVNAGTYTPAMMAQDFTCIATLGTGGCGFEQQLKAMRKAVTTNVQAGACNAGFLRPDSLIALIFVTDEEDCSVREDHTEIFNQDLDLGHPNIRCYLHPDFIEDVTDYVAAFRGLKPSEEVNKIVIGMIVGVPPDAPACIGSGDELDGCLAVAAMTEAIDPAQPTQLIPSCNVESMGFAFPPRRFVTLAQQFGANAFVDSICKNDWRDAIKGITDKLVERLPSTCFPRDLEFDTTTCLAKCKVIETLNNDRSCGDDPGCVCPPATVDEVNNLEPCTGAGGTCEPLKRDLGLLELSDGSLRRLCLVRQATRNPEGDRCSTPVVEGWYYQPRAWSEDACPQVIFAHGTSGSLIDVGSTAELRCLSVLCPRDRSCGPASDPTSLCCTDTEFCASPGTCVPLEG